MNKKSQRKALPRRKAAAYLRSATGSASSNPRYFMTRDQAEAVQAYAARYSMNIVKTYIDEGKGGLRIEGRDGLKDLLADIHSGAEGFDIILMRDMSRWALDINIVILCEDLCREKGIKVRYIGDSPLKNHRVMRLNASEVAKLFRRIVSRRKRTKK